MKIILFAVNLLISTSVFAEVFYDANCADFREDSTYVSVYKDLQDTHVSSSKPIFTTDLLATTMTSQANYGIYFILKDNHPHLVISKEVHDSNSDVAKKYNFPYGCAFADVFILALQLEPFRELIEVYFQLPEDAVLQPVTPSTIPK